MTDQTTTPEPGEPRKKRSHHGPNVVVGRRRTRATSSTKNSHTSPRQLHRRKRIKEAIGYRLQAYSFEQIAAHMKVSVSTAHGYVVEGMNAIPAENARALLRLELERLDAIQSAFFSNATEGDAAAAEMCLRVSDRRARLLGLIPETGRVNVLVAQQSGGEAPVQQIEFVIPGKKPDEEDEQQSPVRGPQPPFPWQRQLPAPVDVPMFRDPLTGAWKSGPTE